MLDISLEAISVSAKAFLMSMGINVYLLVVVLLFIIFFLALLRYLQNNWSSMILSIILIMLVLGITYTIYPDLVLHIVDLLKIAFMQLINSL